MFKPGTILEVSFKNFVTYQEGAVFPGPRLNMFLGANGSGKSTIVAAIILGLGGNPKIIGRGSRISEYVRSNCDDSEIKVVLKGCENEGDITIERHFNTLNKTIWYINGKQTIMSDVVACISKFNIQVNNLCQFLPQDKVQDFAKMSKQELLKQTLIALCRQDLVDIQTDLIKMSKNQRTLLESMINFEIQVDETRGLNARLESKMKNIELRRELEIELAHVKRKKAWVQYDIALADYREVEIYKNSAAETLEAKKQQLAPFKKKVEEVQVLQKSKTAKCTEADNTYKRAEAELEKNSTVQERLKKSIEDIQDEKETVLRLIEERQVEIENCTVKIKQLEHEKEQIHKNNDPEGGIARHIKTLESEQIKVQHGVRLLETTVTGFENEQRNTEYEMRALNAENERIGSVAEKRLQWLQANNRNAYEGAIWLRDHGQGRFRGRVYGPMMLELNVVDPKYCKFLESTIPYQDRIAFTCELKEDMNLLIRILRQEKRLSVNVVHSAETDKPSKSYQPRVPIEQLRKYGLYAYLHTLVTGPEPIMRYIFKNYRLHDVPIGNDTTNKQYEEISKFVPFFYSGEYCFKKSGSRYDKSYSSIVQSALRQDSGCLAINVDMKRIEQIRGRLEEINVQRQQTIDKTNDVNEKMDSLKSIQNIIETKLKDAHRVQQQCKNIDFKLKQLGNKNTDLQKDTRTADMIHNECKGKIKEVLVKLVEHQRNNLRALQALKRASVNISMLKAEIVTIRKRLVHAENSTDDAQSQYDEAKRVLNRVDEAIRTAASTTREQLRRARHLSSGFKPSEPDFNQFRPEFDNLPPDLEELDSKKNMLQTRIDCTSVADENEIREYENRNKQIYKWLHDKQMVDNELSELEGKISDSREKWLRPLSHLVDKISEHFAAAFERMGCAGEVTICTAGQLDHILHLTLISSQQSQASIPSTSQTQRQQQSQQPISNGQSHSNTATPSIDYALYGISIRVTYRNGEPLQELNSVTQSGGERSVATAAYMLSLQTMTPVPFRCVDEINQGMDETNEERVFDLLVDCTMNEHNTEGSSQYFLVTPKLNEKLRYVNGMKIHIVHNGMNAVKQSTWMEIRD